MIFFSFPSTGANRTGREARRGEDDKAANVSAIEHGERDADICDGVWSGVDCGEFRAVAVDDQRGGATAVIDGRAVSSL